MAAADAGPARSAACAGARGRTESAVGRRALPVPSRRGLLGAGGVGRTAEARRRHARPGPLRRRRFADARVGRAENLLMLTRWLTRLGLRTEEQRAWATY